MPTIYMNNYAEFEDMISYSKRNQKYHMGKAIKHIVQKCLSDDTVIGRRRKELEDFDQKYIHSEYPLADTVEYCIFWTGHDMDMLVCHKKR